LPFKCCIMSRFDHAFSLGGTFDYWHRNSFEFHESPFDYIRLYHLSTLFILCKVSFFVFVFS
jgi:hypothetical protein